MSEELLINVTPQETRVAAVENGVLYFSNPTCHHAPEIYSGLMERESSNLLKDFFSDRRRKAD